MSVSFVCPWCWCTGAQQHCHDAERCSDGSHQLHRAAESGVFRLASLLVCTLAVYTSVLQVRYLGQCGLAMFQKHHESPAVLAAILGAQVTLDEVIISWLPAPYEGWPIHTSCRRCKCGEFAHACACLGMRSDESGSLETSPGHALDPTEQQRHSELLSRRLWQ